MEMNFGPRLDIRDLRNHPAAVVVAFALLLAGNVAVRSDPSRKGYYQVEDSRTLYDFCVPGGSGTIFLLRARRKVPLPVSGLEVPLAHPLTSGQNVG